MKIKSAVLHKMHKDYKFFHSISTRWMDNDIYGHINNVTYYSYFDTVANKYLIENAEMDIHNAPIVGYVVHSNCNYISEVSFPEEIEVELRVDKLGNSSVTYALAIFKKGYKEAVAYGEFVHVFVNRKEKKSVSIPPKIRKALEKIRIH
tara:strand:- start:10 stop:456 length:447 start_codon:yes stop_codon:yes gene_type:complete